MSAASFLAKFALDCPALVNFVGGGGKTALILRLLQDCPEEIFPLYTTTMRIHPPPPLPGLLSISCADMGLLLEVTRQLGRQHAGGGFRLSVTREEMQPGLLRGVPADFATRLDSKSYSLIFNEADGARGVALKMPRAGEPAMMDGGSVLIPVVGLGSVGRPAGPSTVFRWEIARGQIGIEEGEVITPEIAARILMHPNGVCRGCASATEVIPFINQVDTPEQDAVAQKLASLLLENPCFPVSRVVYGSVQAGRAFVLESGTA